MPLTLVTTSWLRDRESIELLHSFETSFRITSTAPA